MNQQQTVQELPKYFIDEGWYSLHSRSLEHMIDSRMPPVEGVQGESPERPTHRRRGRGTPAPSTQSTLMESLAKVQGFISSDLTILEAVFRLLLVNQNKPMVVDEISQELAEHGIGILDRRVVTPYVLTRILDGDFYYGIQRHNEA